ncbi:MAG: hypothetical protein Q8N94_03840 [Methanoregula sp.]|nr:hypothetical protein [Methanoregula sp.]
MDDLVLTGTLALIAFFAVIIAGILAVLFFVSWLWSAACAGNYSSILLSLLAIIIAGCAYTGAGYYLLAKEWI